MKAPVFFKSDYTAPVKGSKEPFGRLIYEVTGMEEPERFFKIIPIKPGLSLSFSVNSNNDPPFIEYEVRNTPVEFSFFLSGYCINRINGIGSKKTIKFIHKPGMNTVSSLPNITGDMDFDPGKPIACVGLKIDPNLLFSYLEEKLDQLPKKVLELFDNKKQNYFSCPMSREMFTTAMQVIHPPAYTGSSIALFYESRALELTAMQLEILVGKNLFPKPFYLSKTDLESIHEAREILLKDIQNPPTIANLARLCGINEFKLKKGFKQTFSTTIFSYLKKYRMEKAWHMVQEQNQSVTEAASQVGYTNVSHFIAAFHKQFNVNPGTLKKTWNSRQLAIPQKQEN